MHTGNFSIRYARALLAFANETGAQHKVYHEALTLRKCFSEVPKLRETMENPILPDKAKYAVLEKAIGENVSKEMARFFQLVIKNKRTTSLQYMMNNFVDLYRKQENISIGKLTTAVPMAPHEIERIRQIVVNHKGGTAEFVTHVDPSIIGGFIFDIGVYRLDASIAKQIKSVKHQFIEKNKRLV